MLTHRFTVPSRFLLPFLSLTVLIVQLGLSLSALPSTKLMQDIICKSHLALPPSSTLLLEEDCHGDAIQQELNFVNTGIVVSVTIGGALVAFPMGLLADRTGRVRVLTLSILGLFLSSTYSVIILWKAETIPLKTLWGTGAWLLVGGGRSVAEAMVFTIISDVVPEHKRASWFQCIVSAVISAQILAPLLSRELIKHSIWTPLWLSLGSILLGGSLIALFAPETLLSRSDKSLPLDRSTKDTLRSLLKKPPIYLIPAATVTTPLASTQSEILTRLMPLEFSWTFSESNLLPALATLVTLITLLLLLPGLSFLIRKKHIIRRDIGLLQGSAFFLVMGSLLLTMITDPRFIIAGVATTALASGTPTLSRALLVSFLPNSHHTGAFFAVFSVAEILGFLGRQLGIGALFDVGLGGWVGLPFGMGTVVSLAIGVAIWMVKAPKVVKDVEDEESPGEEAASQFGSLGRYQKDLKV